MVVVADVSLGGPGQFHVMAKSRVSELLPLFKNAMESILQV